ncbi:MAG: hypothetical protein ACLQVD_06935 [Capsulimonadaceae bacterium]
MLATRYFLAGVLVPLLLCQAPVANARPNGGPIILRQVDEPVPKEKPKVVPPHLGETFTLNGDGWSLDFTLKSVEITARRVRIGPDDSEVPNASEKLVVVHFTLENNSTADVGITGDSIQFTAEEPDGTPHEDVPEAANEDTGDLIDGTLHPKDKINVIKVIHFPAAGPVESVSITPSPTGVKPFRIALAGHVARLSPPFADPADPAGMTALDAVNAKVGDFYPMGDCDLALLKTEYTEAPLLTDKGVQPPDPDYHYVVFTFEVTCQNSAGTTFDSGNINATVNFADDSSDAPTNGPLLDPIDGTQKFNTKLQAGQTRRFRLFFPIAKSDTLASLDIQADDTSRKFTYDLKPKKDSSSHDTHPAPATSP